MGAKRASVRTLPSGERVHHHPPTDEFPDGQLVLIRDCSPLKDRHDDRLHEHRRRHRDLTARHQQHIHVKKAVQQANGVPPEKSCI